MDLSKYCLFKTEQGFKLMFKSTLKNYRWTKNETSFSPSLDFYKTNINNIDFAVSNNLFKKIEESCADDAAKYESMQTPDWEYQLACDDSPSEYD